VRDAVLVCMQRPAARGDVSGRNDMQEVLICDKGYEFTSKQQIGDIASGGRSLTIIGDLKRVIQGLGYIREMRSK